jgi:hypothetical protein
MLISVVAEVTEVELVISDMTSRSPGPGQDNEVDGRTATVDLAPNVAVSPPGTRPASALVGVVETVITLSA